MNTRIDNFLVRFEGLKMPTNFSMLKLNKLNFAKALSITADTVTIIAFLNSESIIFLKIFFILFLITIAIFLVPAIHDKLYLKNKKVIAIILYAVIFIFLIFGGFWIWGKPPSDTPKTVETNKVDTLKINDNGIHIEKMNGDIIKDHSVKNVYNNFRDTLQNK